MSQISALKITVVLYPIVFVYLELCSFHSPKIIIIKIIIMGIMKGSISSLQYNIDG